MVKIGVDVAGVLIGYNLCYGGNGHLFGYFLFYYRETPEWFCEGSKELETLL